MSSSAKRICLAPPDTQETIVEKLCDDVLVEIFSYLSAAELKSASLVCKHWDEVIGSSAVVMKKFKLKLKESELLDQQFRSTRNYQNIELEMLAAEDEPRDQDSLENLGRFFELSQVKYFKIFAHNPEADHKYGLSSYNLWRTFSIDSMKLTSALKHMKLLQELFIECLAGFRGSFTATLDLPKLTKIAVKSPDMSIFQWLSASNVTEIDLINQSRGSSLGVQHLTSFLKLCKQITALKLKSSVADDLFGNGKWKDFNLKLSDLEIKIERFPTSLREFLISQALSLTSYRMKDDFDFEDGQVPLPQSFFDTLSQLKNLKVLSHDYGFGTPYFLRPMTELDQLSAPTLNVNAIARFNRKLTYLKTSFVEWPVDAGLEFSELKHLYIGYDEWSNFLKVIKSSPKLETLEFRLDRYRVRRFNEVIKTVLQQPTLRHLKLEYWLDDWKIRHIKEAFDTITSDFGNLKSLSVREKFGTNWRSVEFLFPENRLDWNAAEQKMRLVETFPNGNDD